MRQMSPSKWSALSRSTRFTTSLGKPVSEHWSHDCNRDKQDFLGVAPQKKLLLDITVGCYGKALWSLRTFKDVIQVLKGFL